MTSWDAAAAASGQCLFLIPSPSDELVYHCFRRIGQEWWPHVTDERLLIEGGVPLTPCITTLQPSPLLSRLAGAQLDVISRIELAFGGLTVSYIRSGGHGPTMYRQSFFDEIRLQCEGKTSLNEAALMAVCRTLCTSLDVRRATGTPEFASLFEQLLIPSAPDVHQRL